MGSVYKAFDVELHRDVAIKLLNNDYGNKPKALRREALILSKLHHPHILKVFALGTAETQPYLVTEIIEGTSLSNYLDGRQAGQETILELCRQIASALDHVHKAGILHRDLKPDNVLVTEKNGEVCIKLIDFGLSKDEGFAAETRTITGALVGTPKYMSPEQCRGLPADERSDIYSFGCVACECFTGHAPFSSDSPLGYLALHTSAAPNVRTPVAAAHAQKWREIRQLIYRCLEKDPSNRFASAAELCNQIEVLQSTPESPIASHKGTVATRHVALAIVAAGMVACAVVLLSKWYFKPQSQDLFSVSRTPRPLTQSSYESLIDSFNLNMTATGKYTEVTQRSVDTLCSALVRVASQKQLTPVQICHCYQMLLLLQTTKPTPRYTHILSVYTNASAQLSDRELAVIPVRMSNLVKLIAIAADPLNSADRAFCVQILRFANIRIDSDSTLSKNDIVSLLKRELPLYEKTGEMEAFIEKTESTLKGLGGQMEYTRERCEANFLCAKAQLMLGKVKKLDERQLQNARLCLSEAARLREYLPESIDDTGSTRKDPRDRVRIRIMAGQATNTWRQLEQVEKAVRNFEITPSKAEIAEVSSELDSLRH